MSETQTDDEIVAGAPYTLHAYQNVARGTWGYSVLRLAAEGRLKCTKKDGVLPDETTWTYEAAQ